MGGNGARNRALAVLLAAVLALPAGCTDGSGGHGPRLDHASRLAVNDAVTAFFHDPTGYNDDVRSLLVHVDRKPVVDHYQHTGPGRPQQLGAVTTAVVSILVGIAVERGAFGGIDLTLGELLPAYRSVMTAPVRAVTVRQVLTMTAGFRDDTPQWQAAVAGDRVDWVAAALRSQRSRPGRFHGTDAGTQLLSAVLQQTTGRSLLSLARETLFGPLGITRVTWARDPQRRNLAYGGLRMRPADLAKIGKLMVSHGRWHGRRVVSGVWARASTEAKVTFQQLVEPSGEYGYGWWVLDANGHPAFAAADPSGQLLEVVPDERLVVVLTTRIGKFSRVGVGGPLSWVAQLVVPALAGP